MMERMLVGFKQDNSYEKPLRGYLSVHQTCEGAVIVKWMPNELVHSKSETCDPDDFANTR